MRALDPETVGHLREALACVFEVYRERLIQAGGFPVDLLAAAAHEAGVPLTDAGSFHLKLLAQSPEARKKRRQKYGQPTVLIEKGIASLQTGKSVPIDRQNLDHPPYPPAGGGDYLPESGQRVVGQADQAQAGQEGAGGFGPWRRVRPSGAFEAPDLPYIGPDWQARLQLLSGVAKRFGLPAPGSRDLCAWSEHLKRNNQPWPNEETDMPRLEEAALRTVVNIDGLDNPGPYWAVCYCDPSGRMSPAPRVKAQAPESKNVAPVQPVQQKPARTPRPAPAPVVEAEPPAGFALDAWKALVRCVGRNQYRSKNPTVEASYAAQLIAERHPAELWQGAGLLAAALDLFARSPDWRDICGVSGAMPWDKLPLGRYLQAARQRLGIPEPEAPARAAVRQPGIPPRAVVQSKPTPTPAVALPGESPADTFARVRDSLGALSHAAFVALEADKLVLEIGGGLARHFADAAGFSRRHAEDTLSRCYARKIHLEVREAPDLAEAA